MSQGSIGGEVQVSQGVKRCVRGQGKSRGSKGLKGTSWFYQGVILIYDTFYEINNIFL